MKGVSLVQSGPGPRPRHHKIGPDTLKLHYYKIKHCDRPAVNFQREQLQTMCDDNVDGEKLGELARTGQAIL